MKNTFVFNAVLRMKLAPQTIALFVELLKFHLQGWVGLKQRANFGIVRKVELHFDLRRHFIEQIARTKVIRH